MAAVVAFPLLVVRLGADLPAKFHVLELAGYVPLLWWLAAGCGIEGAAMAWTIRVSVAAALLLYAAHGERHRVDRLLGCSA